MARERKTRDEYDVQGNYGAGWEDLTTEETRRGALARLREYRENAPGHPYRLKLRRVPLELCRVCGKARDQRKRARPVIVMIVPGAPE